MFSTTLRRIYIVRDNDAAGDGAVESLSARARMNGIKPITLSPRSGDFNEDLRILGIDAVRSALRVQLIPEDVARFMRVRVRTET